MFWFWNVSKGPHVKAVVSRVHYWKSGRTIGGKDLCSYNEPWVIMDAPLKAQVVFHSLPLLCSSLVVRRAGELCRMPLLYSVASLQAQSNEVNELQTGASKTRSQSPPFLFLFVAAEGHCPVPVHRVPPSTLLVWSLLCKYCRLFYRCARSDNQA